MTSRHEIGLSPETCLAALKGQKICPDCRKPLAFTGPDSDVVHEGECVDCTADEIQSEAVETGTRNIDDDG